MSKPNWEPPEPKPLTGIRWDHPFDDAELEELALYFVNQIKRICNEPDCLVCKARVEEVRRRVWAVFDLGMQRAEEARGRTPLEAAVQELILKKET